MRRPNLLVFILSPVGPPVKHGVHVIFGEVLRPRDKPELTSMRRGRILLALHLSDGHQTFVIFLDPRQKE